MGCSANAKSRFAIELAFIIMRLTGTVSTSPDAFDGVDGLIGDLPVGRRDDVVGFQSRCRLMPATDAFYGRGDRAKAADDGPRPRA